MIRLTIRKGKHYSWLPLIVPKITWRDKTFMLQRTFLFTSSAIYKLDDDQLDINKLFGFSLGFHHTNSFRFGWRPSADLRRIEILTYEYRNKVRMPAIPIKEVELNKWYTYTMLYDSYAKVLRYAVFEEFGDKQIEIVTTKVKLTKKLYLGYLLGIYFGGNKVAPHAIKINRI